VGRAGGGCAVAVFGEVAAAGRGPADHECPHDAVGTRAVGAVARIGHVTGAGRGSADGASRDEIVTRTVVGGAVANFVEVAPTGGGATHVRALEVRRAGRGDAITRLCDVTDAGGRAADRTRGCRGVGGTIVGDAVADFGSVAGAGRRAADGRALPVGRAARAGAAARLGEIAHARRGPAYAAGGERVGRTNGRAAVTVLAHVTVAGGGPAGDERTGDAVGRARGAQAVAGLGDVTVTGHGPAHRAGDGEQVDRTDRGRAVAGLGGIAQIGAGATHRSGVAARSGGQSAALPGHDSVAS